MHPLPLLLLQPVVHQLDVDHAGTQVPLVQPSDDVVECLGGVAGWLGPCALRFLPPPSGSLCGSRSTYAESSAQQRAKRGPSHSWARVEHRELAAQDGQVVEGLGVQLVVDNGEEGVDHQAVLAASRHWMFSS